MPRESDDPRNPTTPVVHDDGELPPHTVKIAIKWLVWQHGMTQDEATKFVTQIGGPTRQHQRQEAIDVADFVEQL